MFLDKKKTKAIKYKILRHIKNLFEQAEENYYIIINNFGVTIILNMKVMVIKKHYQLNNILMKLDQL